MSDVKPVERDLPEPVEAPPLPPLPPETIERALLEQKEAATAEALEQTTEQVRTLEAAAKQGREQIAALGARLAFARELLGKAPDGTPLEPAPVAEPEPESSDPAAG